MADNHLSKLPQDLNTLIKGYTTPKVYYRLFSDGFDCDDGREHTEISIYLTLNEAVSGLLSHCEKSGNRGYVDNDLYITQQEFGDTDDSNIMGYIIRNGKLKKYLFIGDGYISMRNVIEQPFTWEEPPFYKAFFK